MSKLITQNLKVQLTSNGQKELKAHALQILRRQQDQMKQKLQRELQKNSRVRQIQDKFVEWVEKKNHDTQMRFQRVQKNKQTQIAKIVNKCKTREKYLSKKQQDYKVRKKRNINIAWKKAQKFNQQIQNYYKSKNIMNKTVKTVNSRSDSVHDELNRTQTDNQRQIQRLASKTMNHSTHTINKGKINASFINRTHHAPKDSFLTVNERRPETLLSQSGIRQRNGEQYQKYKIQSQKRQNQLIQQLGKKLEKIQQTRIRRMKNHSKKQSKDKEQQRQRNLTQYKKLSPKKNQKKDGDRLMSEHSYKKQPRVVDRSLDAKLKRQEMFQQHLQSGYQYLQSLKLRHLKTVISKNIAYNAIEKKLYIERLNS